MRNERALIKDAFKALAIILMVMLAARFTKALALFVVVLYGLWAASARKVGKAYFCYIILNLCVLANPFIMPKLGFLFTLATRIGGLALGLMLTMAGVRRQGHHKLPFALLWVYLGIMCLSSATGWFPRISYFKLIQFSVFLLSLSVGLQNIGNNPKDLLEIRKCFLGVALYVIAGSVMIWPFPQYSTLKAVAWYGDEGLADVQRELMANANSGMSLLAGTLYMSQALSTVDAVLTGWVICDMLFVEKRVTKFHLALIVMGLFILVLTRSRTGMFAFAVVVGMVIIYLMPQIRLPARVKIKVKQLVGMGLVLMFAVMVVMELRNHGMSKLIRKTDDLAGDTRGLTEAITSSRQGLIDEAMKDFRLNPIFGMGFQVAEKHRYGIKGHKGGFFIFSASMEKGLLPLMVLGEGGIVGAVVFSLFLITFYAGCGRKKLFVTATLFTAFLGTNMGEATFFSPGGPGGIQWIISIVGGFCIDMILIRDREQRRNLPVGQFAGPVFPMQPGGWR